MNPRELKVGVGQLLVEGGEPHRNLQRAEELINQAAKKRCDIVVLPECLDLGWIHPSARTEAEPIPGLRSNRLCVLAKQNHIYICAGLTEKDGEKIFNTAILINSSGEIILKYRKINELVVGHDIYSMGTSLSVIETPLGTIGVNICADNYIDSLAIGHTLGRMGAQIILIPSAWTVEYSETEKDNPYQDKWLKPFNILAELYDLVAVSATSVGVIVGGAYEGKKSVGCSLVVDRNGIVAKGSYNEFSGELVVADVKLTERKVRGTAIGEMLKKKGYPFAELAYQPPYLNK